MRYASSGWPSSDTLSRLVGHAQDGSVTATEELLAVLRPSLMSFFGRRLSADVAEDLSQLALVRIGRAVCRIDPKRADVYVSTVARNLLRTAYRVEARSRHRDGQRDPVDLVSNAPAADMRVEYLELVGAVHRACLRMRPGLREVAEGVLRGDSAADMARNLDVSPITVRTRLMRVRAILREEVAPYLSGSSSGRS
jgi:RNA polymerase sigma-70 factor (ECF subfamily)